MSSIYGRALKLSIFGESHGAGIGAVLDGLPAGESIDENEIRRHTARRAPGKKAGSTPRREKDEFTILSGVLNGKTTGAPLCIFIPNENAHSSDYSEIADKPRPSHADYTGYVRYNGFNDVRGGGHFSGRLTAPLTAAGSVCRQILERRGVTIGAHIYSIGETCDSPFDSANIGAEALESLTRSEFPTLNANSGEKMREEIKNAAECGDSIGGIIECAAVGLPAGLGSPMFESIESRLSAMLFSVPAVKAVEFGDGFGITRLRGSEANDPFYYDENGDIKTKTNRNGGILGGISTAMPLVFRAGIKPTPSISLEQETVSLSAKENATLKVGGRHDSCIAVRAVPVIESAAALTLLEIMISEGKI